MPAEPVERLFVIVGAGASVDCASSMWRKNLGTHLIPPLVKDLFSNSYAAILDNYPVAQMVAADLQGMDSSALVLEKHIRERYRDSDHPLDRQKFFSIAPYLQDLLLQVSKSYARAPDNHDRLISAVLRLQEVVFVSLNYDTLLDDRLALTSPIRSMDDYTRDREPAWSLVKLHGSVNWGRAILNSTYSLHMPSTDLQVDDEIRLRLGDLPYIRKDFSRTSNQPWQYFPALSVPIGQADEIACPEPHLAFLRDKIGTAFDGVDLLVIGYSANDQEVINLLREAGRPIRSLAVVNRSLADAQQVAGKLIQDLSALGPPTPYAFDGPYRDFATESELARYIDWLRSRPSRAALS